MGSLHWALFIVLDRLRHAGSRRRTPTTTATGSPPSVDHLSLWGVSLHLTRGGHVYVPATVGCDADRLLHFSLEGVALPRSPHPPRWREGEGTVSAEVDHVHPSRLADSNVRWPVQEVMA